MQSVLPLPVLARMTESWRRSMARDAWSWKTHGTMCPLVRSDTTRHARIASSFSLLFKVAIKSHGNWSLIVTKASWVSTSSRVWQTRSTDVVRTGWSIEQTADSDWCRVELTCLLDLSTLIIFDRDLQFQFHWGNSGKLELSYWLKIRWLRGPARPAKFKPRFTRPSIDGLPFGLPLWDGLVTRLLWWLNNSPSKEGLIIMHYANFHNFWWPHDGTNPKSMHYWTSRKGPHPWQHPIWTAGSHSFSHTMANLYCIYVSQEYCTQLKLVGYGHG